MTTVLTSSFVHSFPEPPRLHENYTLADYTVDGAGGGTIDPAAADGEHLLDRPMMR